MNVVVLVCGNVIDGISDTLTGPAEILVEGNRIGRIEPWRKRSGPAAVAARATTSGEVSLQICGRFGGS
jgi:hypothetical protein